MEGVTSHQQYGRGELWFGRRRIFKANQPYLVSRYFANGQYVEVQKYDSNFTQHDFTDRQTTG